MAKKDKETLKTTLPNPKGIITRQNGYLAKPIEIAIKSLENGTKET